MPAHAARGCVINIASTRALQSERDTYAYAAVKGGVEALTHALSAGLGRQVRVNAIAPGWINSRAETLSDIVKAVRYLAEGGSSRGKCWWSMAA